MVSEVLFSVESIYKLLHLLLYGQKPSRSTESVSPLFNDVLLNLEPDRKR